ELGIRQNFAFGDYAPSWHDVIPFSSGKPRHCTADGPYSRLKTDRCFSALQALRLRTLSTVLRATLTTLGDTRGVQAATHSVLTHARQVLDPAAADQHDAVLLQVVAFATDVRGHLVTVGQAYPADFAKGRVRLLRSSRIDAGADTTALRATLQGRYAALLDRTLSGLADQLVDRCHS